MKRKEETKTETSNPCTTPTKPSNKKDSTPKTLDLTHKTPQTSCPNHKSDIKNSHQFQMFNKIKSTY